LDITKLGLNSVSTPGVEKASGFNFDNFVHLLREGVILVDIRIGQYPDGRPHDHGTGFRVLPDKLDLCFSHRERIM